MRVEISTLIDPVLKPSGVPASPDDMACSMFSGKIVVITHGAFVDLHVIDDMSGNRKVSLRLWHDEAKTLAAAISGIKP